MVRHSGSCVKWLSLFIFFKSDTDIWVCCLYITGKGEQWEMHVVWEGVGEGGILDFAKQVRAHTILIEILNLVKPNVV